jgi:hypothetical protein
MAYRAPASGISLTEADAALVKGMLARGDRQHDIAAWFGVNGGRIAEISTGQKFRESSVLLGHLAGRTLPGAKIWREVSGLQSDCAPLALIAGIFSERRTPQSSYPVTV